MKIRKQAFTLVEVMIVVAIVALLATIAIPNLLRARTLANEANARATLKSISTALENYASINNIYPNNAALILGASPPYLPKNYFTGIHAGYTFAATLADYSYFIRAEPIGPGSGNVTFTISTGSVLNEE